MRNSVARRAYRARDPARDGVRMADAGFPTVDLTLARQLERAEAMANAASVESRRAVQPDIGAEWIEVAGVYAMFDGPESPLTQTFGLGISIRFSITSSIRSSNSFANAARRRFMKSARSRRRKR